MRRAPARTPQAQALDIHSIGRAVAFNDPAALGELQGEIDALPARPVLIVVDTLSRATAGLDLDKAKDMNGFVGACDRLRERFGYAVLVVHHSGHGDKGRAMNSIALKGAVDFEAGVRREGDDKLRLASTKAKDAEPFDDIVLRFERVSLDPIGTDPNTPPKPQQSVVLVECEATPETDNAPRPSKNFLLLREIVRTADGPIGTERARDEFVRLHGGKKETARRAFYSALNKTIESGTIKQDPANGFISPVFGAKSDD